jgi:hypothetical protein
VAPLASQPKDTDDAPILMTSILYVLPASHVLFKKLRKLENCELTLIFTLAYFVLPELPLDLSDEGGIHTGELKKAALQTKQAKNMVVLAIVIMVDSYCF